MAPDDGVISARTATVGLAGAAGAGAVPPDPRRPAGMARRGRRRPSWRASSPGTAATLTAGRRRAVAGHGAHGGADGGPGRRATAWSTSTCRADGAALRAGMFARGEFELGAARGADAAAVARCCCATASPTCSGSSAATRCAQTKVDGRPARRRAHRDHRRPRRRTPRVVASGAGFLADGDTVRVVDARGRPAAERSRSAAMNVSVLVDPQPDPGDPAVRHAHAGRA
ncbi:MAG: hypothetical protein MZV49_05610 [Rhodopseudomonas palustris]|nr:hypothetical protein [Rhodopseudomonas palustris]